MKLLYTTDRDLDLETFVANTRWGRIEVSFSPTAIHSCTFTDKPCGRGLNGLSAPMRTFLDEWDSFDRGSGFSGCFVASGTAFDHLAWKALREIPFGQTATYGEIARQIGRPGAARAVGLACNRNPLPLLIPCHRIVGANGKLTGFAGGLDVKARLLAMEQNELPLERTVVNG